MLTSKQRSYLMGQSSRLPTMLHVGKNGLNEGVLTHIDYLLTRHELVKVGVLKNSGVTSKDLIDDICGALSAEPVHAIGTKVILYRYSTAEDVVHVPLDEESAAKQQRDERHAKQQAEKRAAKAVPAKPYRPEKKHGVHKGKGSDTKKARQAQPKSAAQSGDTKSKF